MFTATAALAVFAEIYDNASSSSIRQIEVVTRLTGSDAHGGPSEKDRGYDSNPVLRSHVVLLSCSGMSATTRPVFGKRPCRSCHRRQYV